MMKRIAAAAFAALFLAGVSVGPAAAQTAANKPNPSPQATPAPAAKKTASPAQQAQRQKMKDCAAKWGDHKKTTGAKGRKAYNDFMKPCLKS